MTSRTARLRIDGPGRGLVEVDGHDVSSATLGFTIDGKAGHHTELTLDLLVHVTEVEGEMDVQVPAKTAAALVALGWTPPIGQPVETRDIEHHGSVASGL